MSDIVDVVDNEEEDFLQNSLEFEAWVLNIEASIMFKGKSLIDWNTTLSIPTVSADTELTVSEVELLHNQALNTIETVMSNLSIAKSAYYSAKSNHEISMIRNRKMILDEFNNDNKKPPSSENIEKLCLLRSMKTYKIYVMSEIIHEFWNVQSFKLSRFNERLTSINYIKQK